MCVHLATPAGETQDGSTRNGGTGCGDRWGQGEATVVALVYFSEYGFLHPLTFRTTSCFASSGK